MPIQVSYPSVTQSFKLVLVYLLIMGGVWLSLGMLKEMLPISVTSRKWYEDSDQLLRYAIKLAIWIVLVWKLKKKIDQTPPRLRFDKVPLKLMLGILVLFAVFEILLLSTIAAVVDLLDIDVKAPAPRMNLVWLDYVRTVVLAPVLEEILFRGMILEGLLDNYKPQKAIFVSALVFGLIHFDPLTMVTAFAAGIFGGYIYYRCRSLYPCILLHALNNLLATTVIYFWQ